MGGDPQEYGKTQQAPNEIQFPCAEDPSRQDGHATGNASPDDRPGASSFQPDGVDNHVEEQAGKNDPAKQG